MLNYGTSMLDEILNAGRTDKTHAGLGYTRKPGSFQTIFVKTSASGVKNHDDLKQKAGVDTPTRTLVVTQARGPPADLNQMRNRRMILICH